MSFDSLLVARGLGRRQPNASQWLLRGVDITISGEDRLALSGPTGSGKTVLLRALVGLDPTDEGEVLWRSSKVRGAVVPKFRRDAIYLSQRAALVEGSVMDNLKLPFSFAANRHRSLDRQWVLSGLERVDRGADFLSRAATELSGGERQIVALLRALQLEPALLLLDEPTAALDATSTAQIERLIDDWYTASPGQRAFAWVSHDERQLRRIANRRLTMRGGRLLDDASGSVDDASGSVDDASGSEVDLR